MAKEKKHSKHQSDHAHEKKKTHDNRSEPDKKLNDHSTPDTDDSDQTSGDAPVAAAPSPVPSKPAPTADETSDQPETPAIVDPEPDSADPIAIPVAQPPAKDGPMMLGVNLAGGEFGSAGEEYGYGYIYPSHSEIDYYAGKGMEVIRLPFIWERLQSTEFGALNAEELGRIDDVVDYAASKGMSVVLDLHEYGYGLNGLVGATETSNEAFADFWGKMGEHFADESHVLFGLMNEPHKQSATDWLVSVNGAIDAIRDAGADSQTILVPGTHWDGAWTWTTTDNASVIGAGVEDPEDNIAFEVHQYLDQWSTGTTTQVVSPTIGAERLEAVTEWASDTGNQLFLGEFGAGSDATSLTALDGMLSYMSEHQDVWKGATYWAGGAWWGDYALSIEPRDGVDSAQMNVMEKYADLTV